MSSLYWLHEIKAFYEMSYMKFFNLNYTCRRPVMQIMMSEMPRYF